MSIVAPPLEVTTCVLAVAPELYRLGSRLSSPGQ